MSELEWKLFYGDRTTFSSADGDWLEAPARNVQFLLIADEKVGRLVDRGGDFYLMWPGVHNPFSVDVAGLWDFLLEIECPFAQEPLANMRFDELIPLGVKFGRTIGNREFEEIMKIAVDDPELPPKSAFLPHELT